MRKTNDGGPTTAEAFQGLQERIKDLETDLAITKATKDRDIKILFAHIDRLEAMLRVGKS